MNKVVILVLLFLIVVIAYWKHNQNKQLQTLAAEQARLEIPRTDEEIRQSIRDSLNNNNSFKSDSNNNPVANEISASTPSGFKCDGRTHCSQMSSYEEAKFFINNCPGTKMDGDSDGEPCEDQF